MDVVLVLSVVVLGAVTAAFLAQPLIRGGEADAGRPEDAEMADLETRKQSKYREIADAEIDFRSGKISESDFRRLDGELRAEAIEILKLIDRQASASGGR